MPILFLFYHICTFFSTLKLLRLLHNYEKRRFLFSKNIHEFVTKKPSLSFSFEIDGFSHSFFDFSDIDSFNFYHYPCKCHSNNYQANSNYTAQFPILCILHVHYFKHYYFFFSASSNTAFAAAYFCKRFSMSGLSASNRVRSLLWCKSARFTATAIGFPHNAAHNQIWNGGVMRQQLYCFQDRFRKSSCP